MIKDLKVGSPLFKSLARLTRDELSIANTLLVLRTPTESLFHVPDAWQTERVITMGSMDMHLLRKQHSSSQEPLDDEEQLVD